MRPFNATAPVPFEIEKDCDNLWNDFQIEI
jgi:hypothetical protein